MSDPNRCEMFVILAFLCLVPCQVKRMAGRCNGLFPVSPKKVSVFDPDQRFVLWTEALGKPEVEAQIRWTPLKPTQRVSVLLGPEQNIESCTTCAGQNKIVDLIRGGSRPWKGSLLVASEVARGCWTFAGAENPYSDAL